jgi:ESCRT-I complex subunit VPS28
MVHVGPASLHPADLYAILKCTEKLERAYVRDGVTAKEYEGQCEKLIAQFKMLWGSMKETVRHPDTWEQQQQPQQG